MLVALACECVTLFVPEKERVHACPLYAMRGAPASCPFVELDSVPQQPFQKGSAKPGVEIVSSVEMSINYFSSAKDSL
jgi:hypothetical protein